MKGVWPIKTSASKPLGLIEVRCGLAKARQCGMEMAASGERQYVEQLVPSTESSLSYKDAQDKIDWRLRIKACEWSWSGHFAAASCNF